ncbi:hypothetical protein RB653_003054 [Dictyostelium firmibasis]|uniref:NAD-dependent epimerase/dehydratase domain-containing protein n=1 Tax=Dictyostelium firmibasis TaxID=79012 RepID=A0AAN7YQK2_9MYCE
MISNKNNNNLVAVTGATGYLGAYIVRDLLEKNYRVLAFVRDTKDEEKLKTLKSFDPTGSKLSFTGGDLETIDYEKELKDVNYIVHTASPFKYTSQDSWKEIINPAINGTLGVLKAASKILTIKKVIVTSSGLAVYDFNNNKQVFNDDDWSNPQDPINQPYPYSKVAAEKKAWEFFKENNEKTDTNHFKLVVINPSYILGPALSPLINSSVGTIIRQLTLAEKPRNIAIGVVDVRDVSRAHLIALENEYADDKRILVNNKVVQFKDIANTIVEIFSQYKFNTNTLIEGSEPLIFTLKSNKLDKLNFGEFIPFEETIKNMIQHLLDLQLIKLEFKK